MNVHEIFCRVSFLIRNIQLDFENDPDKDPETMVSYSWHHYK